MRRIRPPFSALRDIELFAVDDRSAQLLVRSDQDEVVVHVGDCTVAAPTVGGVAILELHDLESDTDYEASSDLESLSSVAFRTSPDMGVVHNRFATISDVHLGLEKFGVGRKLTDSGADPYALRCARASVHEACAWGAELLIVKGDLTEQGREADWDLAQAVFDGISVPVLFTPGNHDVTRSQEVSRKSGAARLGTDHQPVQVRDLDGLRIIVADTSLDQRGSGDLKQVGGAIVDAADCDRPVFVTFHHNIQRTPIPWFWPPGIPSTNAAPVVRALIEANPALFLSSGHTHRNRLHWLGRGRTVPYTEVSSTSDYPGVWAGYEVSGQRIRQTVRRIAEPSALEWTERTRRVLGGVWPRWSQGRLDDRCVDFELPNRRSAGTIRRI